MTERDYFLHGDVTDKIFNAFYKVNNTLGHGFLEKVYEKAMILELQKLDCHVETQKQLSVFYEGCELGEFYADMIVDGCVIVELKAAETLRAEHEAQLLNYLKATGIEVGLLLNFGKKAEFKRKIFSNNRKLNKTNRDESADS